MCTRWLKLTVDDNIQSSIQAMAQSRRTTVQYSIRHPFIQRKFVPIVVLLYVRTKVYYETLLPCLLEEERHALRHQLHVNQSIQKPFTTAFQKHL